MSKVHSSKSGKPAKPDKPYADFPLTPHPAGYWCKKIRGKMYYFGPWEDWQGALDKYEAQKDALHAGRKPRDQNDGTTVKELCNAFLEHKESLVDAGELSPRTWIGYEDAAKVVVEAFGKARLVSDLGADDFAELRQRMAKRWGTHRLANTIQYVRSIFKYAFESNLIAVPTRFGPGFKRPSKKVAHLERARAGPKLFAAEEVRQLIDAAGVQLRAMILLAINGGFGNSDCACLPIAAVDLERGWIDFPRPKTGIPRRCPLWPETTEAIRAALAKRTEPKKAEHVDLVFVTKYGDTWGKDSSDNPISNEMAKLMRKLMLKGKRGLNFYALRHVFRTVADSAKDQPATDYLMGHESTHMASVYRETIDDERLVAVVNHVHAWLFPEEAEEALTVGCE